MTINHVINFKNLSYDDGINHGWGMGWGLDQIHYQR
jgi:hypothetical protein